MNPAFSIDCFSFIVQNLNLIGLERNFELVKEKRLAKNATGKMHT